MILKLDYKADFEMKHMNTDTDIRLCEHDSSI